MKEKGGRGGTDMAVRLALACKCWDFLISCSLVAEDKTLLCPLPVSNQTLHFGAWVGVGALIPSPKAVGLECVPPPLSSIPFLL